MRQRRKKYIHGKSVFVFLAVLAVAVIAAIAFVVDNISDSKAYNR